MPFSTPDFLPDADFRCRTGPSWFADPGIAWADPLGHPEPRGTC